MQYYNLNIKPDKKSRSREWLDEKERAPIFFKETRVDELLAVTEENIEGIAVRHKLTKQQVREARLFCEIGRDKSKWDETLIVTIDEGFIWLYRPDGEIEEDPNVVEYGDNLNIVKSFHIKVHQRKEIKHIPLILASMKANQSFSRSTFTTIRSSSKGNIIAIEYLLDSDLHAINQQAQFSPLDCLSSIELETLIAKIFESRGCFVAAYKGGFIAGIDLVVRNLSGSDLGLDGLTIPKGESKSIQVKLKFSERDRTESWADYNISSDPADNPFGGNWIWRQVIESPMVLEWLKHSLCWLPDSVWPHQA